MKTAESARKKVELRERFMHYATKHAENDRIPTVTELRKALGVTNYMLLNCMKELAREGLIYRKSRKEGTFLSVHKKKYVVGFCDSHFEKQGFIDLPAWMSGFTRAFTRNEDFLLRFVRCSTLKKLPAVIRQYGLDTLVWYTSGPEDLRSSICSLPQEIQNKLILAPVNIVHGTDTLPQYNAVGIDHDFWPREYVRAAIRHNCRSFLMVSAKDRISQVMINEIRKQGLSFHEECFISSPGDMKEKLPRLIRKYKIDAVRCAGGMQHSFALAIKAMPSFRPFLPFFGSEGIYQQMKRDYPWLNVYFLFEHLDDFYDRMGFLTGKAAFELIRNGKPFESQALKMNFSQAYTKMKSLTGKE